MAVHPVFSPENVAVIAGGADGISLASARMLHWLGIPVCISDVNADALQ